MAPDTMTRMKLSFSTYYVSTVPENRMKRDLPWTPPPPPDPSTHTCCRGRGGQLGEVKASRGQMAVD